MKRQAEDRAWRNGQRRPVTVINPLVPGTIDEDLYRLLEAKTDIENDLIDASQAERAMMQSVMAGMAGKRPSRRASFDDLNAADGETSAAFHQYDRRNRLEAASFKNTERLPAARTG